MLSPAYRGRIDFGVPVTAGQYAQDTFGLLGYPTDFGESGSRTVMALTVVVATLVASSQVEVWLLDPSGADPSNIASYYPSGIVLTTLGPSVTPFASWPGMLVRCRSGGTQGTTTVLYSATG